MANPESTVAKIPAPKPFFQALTLIAAKNNGDARDFTTDQINKVKISAAKVSKAAVP